MSTLHNSMVLKNKSFDKLVNNMKFQMDVR